MVPQHNVEKKEVDRAIDVSEHVDAVMNHLFRDEVINCLIK